MEQVAEETKPSVFFKLKRFAIECRRVLAVTKKPTGFEFKTIVKVSGLGILIIGFIGFLFQMIRDLLFML
ncbi:protein translocase SEC61 complex subunit gamma [Candidatus Woesearchaeota archaeon]|nr:protein translocase SEC61 complex subunit gamma [Candidatus Woesearchaeota archaeon]